jgi:hypothetical protein
MHFARRKGEPELRGVGGSNGVQIGRCLAFVARLQVTFLELPFQRYVDSNASTLLASMAGSVPVHKMTSKGLHPFRHRLGGVVRITYRAAETLKIGGKVLGPTANAFLHTHSALSF